MATQLAREAGAYVIGTARATHPQTARDFGAQEFVDLENDALEHVGRVNLVSDVFGGDIGKRSAGLVRAAGMLVTVAGPPEARPTDGLAVGFAAVSSAACPTPAPHARDDAVPCRWRRVAAREGSAARAGSSPARG